MKSFLSRAIVAAALLFPSIALAQTTFEDQLPIPLSSTNGQSELLTQSISVSGGTLYLTTLRQPGIQGQPAGVAQTFVPVAAGGLVRYVRLTDAKSDLGVPMTAAAGTPSGTVGVSRTAGTSLALTGEATSGAAAKTDKALFEFNLPDTYVAGANIPVTVNCTTSGTTITAASTTMTVAAYTEVNGVETALTVSAAQQIPATAANLVFTVTGTALTPGQHVVVELVMLVTTSAGAGTGTINAVSYQG